MEVVSNNYMAGDPRLVDQIVYELKSQGIFDQFRKECISDVDTKPAYQNLRQRVEGSVTSFLKQQKWKPDMNKNQVREMLRKNIYESGFLETGVERIVDQVVNPKINTIFLPQVEEVVYKFFGVEKPSRSDDSKKDMLKVDVSQNDLLPKDLEAVSPESVSTDKKEDVSLDDSHNNDDVKMEEDESPPFEPLEEQAPYAPHEENSVDSHMSGFSGLASHESNHSSDMKGLQIDLSNQDSQMSRNSSESRLSIVTSDENSKMEICDDSQSKSLKSNDSNSKMDIIESKPNIESTTDESKSIKNKTDEKKSRSSDKYKSRNDRKDDRDRKISSSKDKSRHTSSSSSKDKDKNRERKDSKSSSSKDRNDKEKSDREKSDRDKSKSSSSSKYISSSRDDKSSSSRKDSKDKSRSTYSSGYKDSKSKSSHSDSKLKSSSSSSDKYKKDDKYSSNSKHSSSSSKRDKDRKRDTKKDVKDDHYSSKDKKNDRRSTDRDSNDGQSSKQGNSHSMTDSNSSQSQKASQESTGSNSGSGSGDSGNSDNTEVNQTLLKAPINISIDDNEVVLAYSPKQETKVKLNKPKFASNIHEARKLMKIRKQLAILEKQNQLSLSNMDYNDPKMRMKNGFTEPAVTENAEGEEDIQSPLPLKSAVLSKESWDAHEAKLYKEMAKMNCSYDSSGDDGIDSEVEKNSSAKDLEVDLNQCRYLEKPTESLERNLEYLNSYLDKLQKDVVENSGLETDSTPKSKSPKCSKRKNEEQADVKNNNKKNVYEKVVETKVKRKTLTANSVVNNSSVLLENFTLPLSPAESEASNDKKDESSEVTGAKPKRTSNKSSMLAKQRYSSDDLYKPRPMFTSSRRRGAKNVDN